MRVGHRRRGAECILVVFAQTPRASRIPHRAKRRGWVGAPTGRPGMLGGPNPMAEWEVPYGLQGPIGGYALAASRHMAQYGTTAGQLATIAVKTREWASLNPRAKSRDALTVDDVLASDMVASPLHKLDCCLVTDGAGAFIVTAPSGPATCASRRCTCSARRPAHTHMMISQMPDLTITPGALSRPKAFAMAGIKPAMSTS